MADKQEIQELLRGFTTETTPRSADKIPDYREHLRAGTTVYVTFLPGQDFDDTVRTCVRLRGEGFVPVPHFAARSIPDRRFLERGLERVTSEAGVDQALVIAGGVDDPVGEFDNSMQLLETGLFDRHGVRRIGVAGHPEGSPDMSDEAIRAALAWKNAFAERTGAELYVVTQFLFEAEPVIAWDKRLRAEGNRLPIVIGLPGLATLKTLLAHAKACGIGNSMRVLTRQARNLSKLMSVQTPDRMVVGLAEYRARDPACGIQGVHMYPLGGLKKTALWTYAVVDGNFAWNRRGDGFEVDLDALETGSARAAAAR